MKQLAITILLTLLSLENILNLPIIQDQGNTCLFRWTDTPQTLQNHSPINFGPIVRSLKQKPLKHTSSRALVPYEMGSIILTNNKSPKSVNLDRSLAIRKKDDSMLVMEGDLNRSVVNKKYYKQYFLNSFKKIDVDEMLCFGCIIIESVTNYPPIFAVGHGKHLELMLMLNAYRFFDKFLKQIENTDNKETLKIIKTKLGLDSSESVTGSISFINTDVVKEGTTFYLKITKDNALLVSPFKKHTINLIDKMENNLEKKSNDLLKIVEKYAKKKTSSYETIKKIEEEKLKTLHFPKKIHLEKFKKDLQIKNKDIGLLKSTQKRSIDDKNNKKNEFLETLNTCNIDLGNQNKEIELINKERKIFETDKAKLIKNIETKKNELKKKKNDDQEELSKLKKIDKDLKVQNIQKDNLNKLKEILEAKKKNNK